eukprot:2339119-Prymnesium_polylepis.1
MATGASMKSLEKSRNPISKHHRPRIDTRSPLLGVAGGGRFGGPPMTCGRGSRRSAGRLSEKPYNRCPPPANPLNNTPHYTLDSDTIKNTRMLALPTFLDPSW